LEQLYVLISHQPHLPLLLLPEKMQVSKVNINQTEGLLEAGYEETQKVLKPL
jgi:hypothetical protein